MGLNKEIIQSLEAALNLLHNGQCNEAMLKCHEIADSHCDKPEIFSLCAQLAQQSGRLDLAVLWIKAAMRLDSRHPDYHLTLGKLSLQMHKVHEAIASFANVLIFDPTHAPAYLQLGRCYFEIGECQDALKHIQKSIQLNPNLSDAYYWLGIIYANQNKHRQAIGCLEKSVVLDPNFTEANYQLGLLYLKDGKLVQSRDCFYKDIKGNNSDWRAWGNLCLVLRDLGELDEALLSGHQATSLNPDSFQVWHNLANVYKDMGRYQESISCYEKALSLNSKSELTLSGLGIAYQRMGNKDKAVSNFEKALAYNPSSGTSLCNLLNICMMECDWEKFLYYKKMVHNLTIESLRARQVPAETPFINLARCDDPELNMSVARAWSRNIEDKMSGIRASMKFKYHSDRRPTIHIGYLSNNFGDHPTAHITRRLYQLHDRRRFKISCFSFGSKDSSRYRQAVQSGCDNFIDIRKLSYSGAAKAINDLGVDILVDLVGFMKGQRLAIAALRPAPVQARWLGMPGTSGAQFFDYLITDRIVTPENQASFYSEKFVYLPYCYQINDNQPYTDESDCRRSDYGLPEDAFVFCCFNTSYKIDPVIFQSWMNILRRLPESVLWLMASSKKLRENLRKRAYKHSIKVDRLIFAEKLPKYMHLSRLSLADLVLDTHRVNGAASTSDALWAGVPVITIQGKHFASTMSSSILKAVGLNALVTNSHNEYENQAVKLAKERKLLTRIKSKLTNSCLKLHLFNTEESVKQLERAYEIIFQRHLDGKKPRMTYIMKTHETNNNEVRI